MNQNVMPGGGFLVADTPLGTIFTRENLTEFQLEMGELTEQFIRGEVLPRTEAVEQKREENGTPVVIQLLKEAGRLGLMAVDIDEEYGGLGQDKTSSMYLAEKMAGLASFATTLGAHAGIGTLPILFFGNPEQKAKYLPLLASGELVSCYALTEPGSGSDALSGRTTAVLSEDGTHYLITGEKQFITNGGWAELAIVFAQVDGRYSSLIVDLGVEGVTRGTEEKKMGLKGSSTTSLSFQNVRVPVENMLGTPGMAAKIALNILNIGRLKLGFAALGNCKYAIDKAVHYALERKQFGQSIASFDLQKARIAEMVVDTFALDSLSYRAVGDIDRAMEQVPRGEGYHRAMINALRTYALECSMVKIAGSETLQEVTNAAIRIHGGYGFVAEYEVERMSRDNVVDTLYEGTNDVNYLTMFDTLARNIFGGVVPFREYMETLNQTLRNGRVGRDRLGGPLGEARADVNAGKRVTAFVVNHAIIHCGKNIKNEQQVMGSIAFMLLGLYAMESTVARVYQLVEARGASKCEAQLAIADLVCHKNGRMIRDFAEDVIGSVVSPGQRPQRLADLQALTDSLNRRVNVVQLRRTVAENVAETGRYTL